MPVSRSVFAVIACALLLAACGDSSVPVASPPAATGTPPPSDLPPVPPPPTAGSVAPQVAPGGQGVDSKATQPMAPLSKEKEVNSMPLAGQGNNHSSPSLETKPDK